MLKPHIFNQFRLSRYFTWTWPTCPTAPPAAALQDTSRQSLFLWRFQHLTSPSVTTVNSATWEYLLKSLSALSICRKNGWAGGLRWLKRSLETPKVLSETCNPAAHTAQSLWSWSSPSPLQGKDRAYTLSPLSDWSPESADCLARAQNKNQTVHSHAQASNKLQGKEKEKKKVKKTPNQQKKPNPKPNTETHQVFG